MQMPSSLLMVKPLAPSQFTKRTPFKSNDSLVCWIDRLNLKWMQIVFRMAPASWRMCRYPVCFAQCFGHLLVKFRNDISHVSLFWMWNMKWQCLKIKMCFPLSYWVIPQKQQISGWFISTASTVTELLQSFLSPSVASLWECSVFGVWYLPRLLEAPLPHSCSEVFI